jgi:TRAP-type uncharacterized transport system substrate-binding protein
MLRKTLRLLMLLVIGMTLSSTAMAGAKTDVSIMTLPFGTPSYLVDMAIESLYSEQKDSKLNVKLSQTPGALYIIRYFHDNQEKLKSGKVAQPFFTISDSILPYMAEGRPPLKKFAVPTLRALWGQMLAINTFVTFDKSIKTPADLAGKKVGFAEKARPFQSMFPNMPYFNKGYDGYNKVKWQHLGAVNSKDALLNGSIDAVWATLFGKLDYDEKGNIICKIANPSPPLLELMNAGRPLYFVKEDPAIIKSSYEAKTDLVMMPVLVKKGAFKGIEEDYWTRGMQGIVAADASMPDEVAVDLITTVFKNYKRLSEYQGIYNFFPDNPYPINVPKENIHPGMFKALKVLGLEVPVNAK